MSRHEDLYRLAVEQVVDYAIFMIAPDGRAASWNAGVGRVLGWAEADWIGRPLEVIFPPEDAAAGAAARELDKARADGRASDDRWQVRRDGARIWASGITTALYDDRGNLIGFMKVMRDLTAQKREEVHLATQHAVSAVLAASATLDEAAPKLLRTICESTDWQWAALWRPDRAGGVLRLVDSWHAASLPARELEGLSRQLTFAPGVGLPGRTWADGTVAWAADVARDGPSPRAAAAVAAGLRGAACFPVMGHDGVRAVVEFFGPGVGAPDGPLLAMMAAVGGQVGQFIDRKAAEETLRATEALHAASVNAALDCIISMDHLGRITEWNPAAQRTFGWGRDEVIGREMAELIIPPALREAHRTGIARYLETGIGPVLGKRLEIGAVRRDGTEFPIELAITPLPTGGPPIFAGFVRDITERRGAASALAEARDAAERSSRAKDDFLAALSHELRTPLTPVLLTLSLLERRPDLPAGALDDVRTIQRNVELEARLIDDLLDLTRIARGKLSLHPETTDLHRLVRNAIDISVGGVGGRTVETHLEAGKHHVRGDPARLQQIYWNLLNNALKFTPAGGTITVSSSDAPGGRVRVEVADSGIGIAPDLLPQLFNAFEQGGQNTTRTFGGLGLGLAICRALVDAHGGTLAASSPGLGEGATFAVELPTTASPSGAGADARPAGDPGGRARRLRVLLVDDHGPTLDVMSRLVKRLGHDVSGAATLAAAMAAAAREPFELIISDIGLPDGSGRELIRAVRARPGGDAVRAIALSGYGMDEDVRRSLDAGFDAHLTKPVDFKRLEQTIREVAES